MKRRYIFLIAIFLIGLLGKKSVYAEANEKIHVFDRYDSQYFFKTNEELGTDIIDNIYNYEKIKLVLDDNFTDFSIKINIKENQYVTLDLNGHHLDVGEINNKGELTIIDSSVDKKGSFFTDFTNEKTGKVYFKEGEFKGYSNKYTDFTNYGLLNVYDSAIISGYTSNSGNIAYDSAAKVAINNAGTCNIYGGIIQCCVKGTVGSMTKGVSLSAIGISNPSGTMTGGEIIAKIDSPNYATMITGTTTAIRQNSGNFKIVAGKITTAITSTNFYNFKGRAIYSEGGKIILGDKNNEEMPILNGFTQDLFIENGDVILHKAKMNKIKGELTENDYYLFVKIYSVLDDKNTLVYDGSTLWGNTLPDFELSIPDGYEIRDGLNIQDKKFYKNEEIYLQLYPILISSISIEQKDHKILLGGQEKLSIQYTPSKYKDDDSILWKSSNTEIVEIDSQGNIKASKLGVVTITAMLDSNPNKIAKCVITVYEKEHIWDEGKIIKEATCEKNGEILYTCKNCKETILKNVIATGHKSDNGTITVQPTETKAGIKTYKCTVCGKILKEESIPATSKKDNTTTKPQTKPATPKPSIPSLKVGTKVTDKKTKAIYKVTGNNTVGYVKITSKAKSITIPTTITVNGVKCQVTSIAAKAFANNKKLTRVVIPASVRSIGKQAFSGCKNLKNITIKTKYLTKKSVGVKAFKGIHAKATIKVPKKQKKAYQKMLKTKGIGKGVKVK